MHIFKREHLTFILRVILVFSLGVFATLFMFKWESYHYIDVSYKLLIENLLHIFYMGELP